MVENPIFLKIKIFKRELKLLAILHTICIFFLLLFSIFSNKILILDFQNF